MNVWDELEEYYQKSRWYEPKVETALARGRALEAQVAKQAEAIRVLKEACDRIAQETSSELDEWICKDALAAAEKVLEKS